MHECVRVCVSGTCFAGGEIGAHQSALLKVLCVVRLNGWMGEAAAPGLQSSTHHPSNSMLMTNKAAGAAVVCK